MQNANNMVMMAKGIFLFIVLFVINKADNTMKVIRIHINGIV